MRFIWILVISIWSAGAMAYPEFIGVGYSSCLTCHYNSHGNGPLNDYGRALFSAEIASQALTGNKTEEELSDSSGVFGTTKLPWWLRPGAKMRALAMQTDPGGPAAKTRTILMQADVNVALLLDKRADKAIVASYGYAPVPERFETVKGLKKEEWISREHYFRWHVMKPLWLYMGMTDKVYGIRNVNHTAYSRMMTGLAQNDQTHGLVAHYIQPTWEFTFNPFIGNLYQDAELRQAGASALFEYELEKDWRLGVSVLSSANKYIKNERAGVSTRIGLGYGAAVLGELGIIRDTPKSTDKTKMGYYMYSQISQRLVRGYYLAFSAQAYKAEMNSKNSDIVKGGMGLLMFPYPRFEFRLDLENTRKIASSSVTKESWLLMAQLHMSL